MALNIMGIVLVGGGIGTLTQHSGWWIAAAVGEIVLGGLLMVPIGWVERLRKVVQR